MKSQYFNCFQIKISKCYWKNAGNKTRIPALVVIPVFELLAIQNIKMKGKIYEHENPFCIIVLIPVFELLLI